MLHSEKNSAVFGKSDRIPGSRMSLYSYPWRYRYCVFVLLKITTCLHVWWIVAQDRQIYPGTLTGQGKKKYTGAFLMASADDGENWQRLIEEPFPQSGFGGYWSDSRRLSANGWLYFATETGRAYRVRRNPITDAGEIRESIRG